MGVSAFDWPQDARTAMAPSKQKPRGLIIPNTVTDESQRVPTSVSWMQGGYRYAIQSAQLTRGELLRIAESLTPVVAADGAPAEVTRCSRTACGGTVVGAFTLRAGDLAAQDETRGGASGPHPLRSGFRDYPSDTPIVLCFLDGFIAATGGPPPIPPATFRPYDPIRGDPSIRRGRPLSLSLGIATQSRSRRSCRDSCRKGIPAEQTS